MNFLYNANINNKIKDLSEIKEYDNIVDYINLFVYEENTKYNYYKIGDLVFVHHYKYNNGNKGINHIFLIVDIYQNKKFTCYFGMLISSKIEKLKYKFNKYIKKDNNEYEVKQEEETDNYYIEKNKDEKEYLELNSVPLVAKVTMKKNTFKEK